MPRKPAAKHARSSRNPRNMQMVRAAIAGQGGAYFARPRVFGPGGYWTDLGAKYGGRIGSWLGGRAMSALTGGGAYKRRRITGKGSYNEVMDGKIAPLPPTFATSKADDYVEINHREFVGDILSSSSAGAFAVQSFNINAGDSLCFPWLSQIASSSFQQYQFQGLIFEFKSMSADALNSTNTALGSVIASMNYDATDAVPVSRAQMENTDWSQCSKPSESFSIPIECKPNLTSNRGFLYTRQSLSVPSGADRKSFDLGVLSIATTGVQGTSVNLGSLYVTYKVRLYKAVQFAPNITGGFLNLLGTGATTTALHFGVIATQVVQSNNMGATFAASAITIPRSRCVPGAVYNVQIHYKGGSASVAGPTVTLSGSASTYAQYSSDGTAAGQTGTGVSHIGTNTELVVLFSFQIAVNPTADAVITLSGGTLPTATCYVQCVITQRNGDTTTYP